MAVVVNEFEVVTAQPRAEEGAPAAPPQPPSPDPAKEEERLERALRHLHARAARLHAT